MLALERAARADELVVGAAVAVVALRRAGARLPCRDGAIAQLAGVELAAVVTEGRAQDLADDVLDRDVLEDPRVDPLPGQLDRLGFPRDAWDEVVTSGDAIRDELAGEGIVLEDGPGGTTWRGGR